MSGEGSGEWQLVGKQMVRQETQRVPAEVQALEFSTEPPNLVSALWGEAGRSAEAAATWGDGVKW